MAVLEVIKERGDVVDLLKELAFDLTWTWEPRIQAAFEALDPELWEASGHNPVVLLNRLGQDGVAARATVLVYNPSKISADTRIPRWFDSQK